LAEHAFSLPLARFIEQTHPNWSSMRGRGRRVGEVRIIFMSGVTALSAGSRVMAVLIGLVLLPVFVAGAEPAAGGDSGEVARLRRQLSILQLRLDHSEEDNQRLNREVKASTLQLGSLQQALTEARRVSSVSGAARGAETDRLRIAELEAVVVSVREVADRADKVARDQAVETGNIREALQKRLAEATAEVARLQQQVAATGQAQASALMRTAIEKKRAETH
jgi:chromosome segregation ATPase